MILRPLEIPISKLASINDDSSDGVGDRLRLNRLRLLSPPAHPSPPSLRRRFLRRLGRRLDLRGVAVDLDHFRGRLRRRERLHAVVFAELLPRLAQVGKKAAHLTAKIAEALQEMPENSHPNSWG